MKLEDVATPESNDLSSVATEDPPVTSKPLQEVADVDLDASAKELSKDESFDPSSHAAKNLENGDEVALAFKVKKEREKNPKSFLENTGETLKAAGESVGPLVKSIANAPVSVATNLLENSLKTIQNQNLIARREGLQKERDDAYKEKYPNLAKDEKSPQPENSFLQKYPGLSKYGLKIKYSTDGKDSRGEDYNGRKMEFYPPGESYNFSPGNPSVEIFDKSMSDKDMMGELYSHYLPQVDAEFSKGKKKFLESLTEDQKKNMLLPDYLAQKDDYDKMGGGPKSFDEFIKNQGGDAYFRGYVTGQYPADSYTPDQKKLLSGLESKLTTDRLSKAEAALTELDRLYTPNLEKRAAEIEANQLENQSAVEQAVVGTMSLGRKIGTPVVRALKRTAQGMEGGTPPDTSEEDEFNDFIRNASEKRQIMDSAEGKVAGNPNQFFRDLYETTPLGAVQTALSGNNFNEKQEPLRSPEELAKAGARFDPQAASDMSIVADPVNIATLGTGGAVAKGIGKVIEPIAEGAGRLKGLVSPVVSKVAGESLKKVGSVVNKAEDFYNKPVVGFLTRGAIGAAIVSPSGNDGAMVSGALGAAFAPWLAGRGGRGARFARLAEVGLGKGDDLIQAGKQLTGELARPIPIYTVAGKPSLLTRAGKALAPELAGAGGGLGFSIPFLALAENNQERGQTLAGGLVFGTIGATSERPAMALDAYWNAAKNPRLKGTLLDQHFDYGTDPELDVTSHAAISQLAPEKQSEINRAKDLMRGVAEVYVLPSDEFRNRFGGDQAGVHIDAEGKRIFMNADTAQLGHELGHPIIENIKANDPASYAQLLKAAEGVDLKPFQERYEKALSIGGNERKLTREEVINEFLAEQTQLAINGKPLSEAGANNSIGRILTGATGRLLERMGFGNVPTESLLGVKPSFISEKVISDWIDSKARQEAKRNPVKVDGNKMTPEPTPSPSPYVFAEAFRGKLYEEEDATVKAEKKEGIKGRREHPLAVTNLIKVTTAAHELANMIKAGAIDDPESGVLMLDSMLSDSDAYMALTPEEKTHLVDFIADDPDGAFDFFASRPEDPNAPKPQTQEEQIKILTEGKDPAKPLSGVSLRPPVVPVTTGQPSLGNIRVDTGTGPKASIDPFKRSGTPSEVSPLSRAPDGILDRGFQKSRERVIDEAGNVGSVEGDSDVGKAFGPNDEPLRQAVIKDANNPQIEQTINATESAIQNGKEMDVLYESAASEIEGSPTNKERAVAQDEAKYGLVTKQGVQKTGTPQKMEVKVVDEPVFTPESRENAKIRAKEFFRNAKKKDGTLKSKSNARHFKDLNEALIAIEKIGAQRHAEQPVTGYSLDQSKLVHSFFDKEPKTRLYGQYYSQDKVIANAKNLADSLADSNLLNDSELNRAYRYLMSHEWTKDLVDRNENMAKGWRGDGGIFLDAQGKDPSAAFRQGNPTKIPDWKVQVLNAIEGGPSGNFYPEAIQNARTAGRKITDNPQKESANPFFQKLKDLKDNLFLARGDEPTAGIGNIISPASETLRLDRVLSVGEESPVELPPSSYAQRAAAFSPKPENDAHYLELAKDPKKNKQELQKMVDKAAENTKMRLTKIDNDDWIDPDDIEPYHGLNTNKNAKDTRYGQGTPKANRNTLASLVKSFKNDTYYGPPVLLYNLNEDRPNAITGTHRIKAAQIANKAIPYIDLEKRMIDIEGFKEKLEEVLHYEDIEDLLREYADEETATLFANDLKFDTIKSTDPITYDNQGNVIPLSQRFSPSNPDIRFSPKAAPAEHIGDWDMEAAGLGKVPFFNFTEDALGYPKGSTVGAETLKDLGFTRPEGYEGQFSPKADDQGFSTKESNSSPFGEWGASTRGSELIGYRGESKKGDANLGTMAATEGIGAYISKNPDMASQFGKARRILFTEPSNPIIADELYILTESDEIMHPVNPEDSDWLKANKYAVQKAGVTDNNWGSKTEELHKALTKELLSMGYDSVIASQGTPDEFLVLLKNKSGNPILDNQDVRYSPKGLQGVRFPKIKTPLGNVRLSSENDDE